MGPLFRSFFLVNLSSSTFSPTYLLPPFPLFFTGRPSVYPFYMCRLLTTDEDALKVPQISIHTAKIWGKVWRKREEIGNDIYYLEGHVIPRTFRRNFMSHLFLLLRGKGSQDMPQSNSILRYPPVFKDDLNISFRTIRPPSPRENSPLHPDSF